MKAAFPTAGLPVRVTSPPGLSFDWTSNGSIRRIDHGDILINLFLGNEMEGGPVNLYLRRYGATIEALPLLGPRGVSRFVADDDGVLATGEWGDLTFTVRLVLAREAAAWFWHVDLTNKGAAPTTCDLILTQDVGLAHYAAVRLNEYYVSQYIDHSPLHHPQHGTVVASRQNQPMGGRHPWLLLGSLGRAVAYATDALQFHGLATRAGGPPGALAGNLPASRRQHEHSLVCLQDELVVLEPGASCARGFFGWYESNKQGATGAADLATVNMALALPEATPPVSNPVRSGQAQPVTGSYFVTMPLLGAREPDPAALRTWFGSDWQHVECEAGCVLSFFTPDDRHVVTRAKDLQVLRPHGHLLRSSRAWVPDEAGLTSTVWMAGVFHSMVTQGHVSINRFLSTCHSYLGLFRSHGQRIFMETATGWSLLDEPSAFEIGRDRCRWIYQHAGGVVEVTAATGAASNQLRLAVAVLSGAAVRWLVCHHVAIDGDDGSQSQPATSELVDGGVFIRAVAASDVGRRFAGGGFRIMPAAATVFERIGGDELLFADGISRQQPFVCLVTAPAMAMELVLEGCLIEPEVLDGDAASVANLQWRMPPGSELAPALGRLTAILPWWIHNALIHYLSPRGLEQYSGGGWGTRDVCQGPLELLVAMNRGDLLPEMLERVFRQQNADGDWPQWFMFFERERHIRPGDSHGDIVYWPVLALAQYLTKSGDVAILERQLPFYQPPGETAEVATLWQHVERAVAVMRRRVIAGTHLAAYGHGDWNDSLQPARPQMREQLCSSWTVTLAYQTYTTWAAALQQLGHHERASEFATLAAEVLAEFQQLLVIDGVVAGMVDFGGDDSPEVMIHPRDETTGLRYSLLPMVHAIINDMLTPEQVRTHLAMIRTNLLGPDGARLFDRPLAYHGGLQQRFQRAETATFFGREIGLMYMHAHLRYCEALAHVGAASEFFHALCQANPIGVRELVPAAALRQANCYYSSSDAAFGDRYQAFDQYGQIARGEVTLDGGWRVYSSGAGIGVRLIVQCLLGLREDHSGVLIDPVMPAELDGMAVRTTLGGRAVEVIYRIHRQGHGTVALELNGQALGFSREPNPYRPGAARIPSADFQNALRVADNVLTVWLM